jgi:hypothetical protein
MHALAGVQDNGMRFSPPGPLPPMLRRGGVFPLGFLLLLGSAQLTRPGRGVGGYDYRVN